ncbi:hypothetical protein, partial [Candidatus Accumulibacter vicinus]|uniref:hypothetical protein n=1 Tax=Candidatus Accumulibacter vicinus TaxID=2954382 RepID=UPI00235B6457
GAERVAGNERARGSGDQGIHRDRLPMRPCGNSQEVDVEDGCEPDELAMIAGIIEFPLFVGG